MISVSAATSRMPDIEPLPGERMDGMRGIADQHQPFADEASRDLKIEGKGLARAGERDVAETRPKRFASSARKLLRRPP